MDALDLLLGRSSALKLGEPAPTSAQLEIMLRAAVAAPDHGRLRPWRFVVVPTDQREQFGELMAQVLLRRDPSASPPMLARERDKAMRAPLIVVAAAHIRKDRPIPAIEQIGSAAAAVQNIMLAAHALGLGAMWKTGAPAYDAAVKQALGFLTEDEIIGFLYLGTRADGEPAVARPEIEEYVTVWQGGTAGE